MELALSVWVCGWFILWVLCGVAWAKGKNNLALYLLALGVSWPLATAVLLVTLPIWFTALIVRYLDIRKEM